MKTLRILFALFTTVIILTACTSDFSTNEGVESSITRITPTKTYSLSDVTKKENKETIIITEAIDVSQDEVSDMPNAIIKFIKSADKTMTEHNHYLISTDTTGLIPYSRYTRTDTLVITLIFKKNN